MMARRESAQRTIDTFRRATESNAANERRRGNVVEVAAAEASDVLISGDLHGHRINFHHIAKMADLANHLDRHLVLQEVCHGGPTYPQNFGCMSHLLLEDVAKLKIEFGDRVHFLLSNHEMAELTDFPIAKGNRMLNLAFRCGLREMYGEDADEVREAAVQFIASCPLALRLENRIFICHSVPDNIVEHGYDVTVFDRPISKADLQSGGAVFRLVWGRDYREENVKAFATLVNADHVIHGHERCPDGARVLHNCQVILDCCDESACVALVPLGKRLTFAELDQCIRHLGK